MSFEEFFWFYLAFRNLIMTFVNFAISFCLKCKWSKNVIIFKFYLKSYLGGEGGNRGFIWVWSFVLLRSVSFHVCLPITPFKKILQYSSLHSSGDLFFQQVAPSELAMIPLAISSQLPD